MATKRELEDIIVRVDESLNGKGGVLDRLKEYNSKAAVAIEKGNELSIKLAKTTEIAYDASEKAELGIEKADSNRKWFYIGFSGLSIAVITALATILAQII